MEEIRRVIRDARAKDPLITVARLEATLEEHLAAAFSPIRLQDWRRTHRSRPHANRAAYGLHPRELPHDARGASQDRELLAKEIRYDPLPDDVRVVVIKSWRNFGLLPEATIQQMVPTTTVRPIYKKTTAFKEACPKCGESVCIPHFRRGSAPVAHIVGIM